MINMHLTQRSMMIICVALAALLGITFLYIAWQWRQDWLLAHQPLPTPTIKPDESATIIASIPDEHLFGQAITASVPFSSLQLQVTGIVKIENGKDDKLSRAYISIAGQAGKIYRVGDNVTDGVKIYAITKESVILEREGRLEKLTLPRVKLEFKPKPSRGIGQ